MTDILDRVLCLLFGSVRFRRILVAVLVLLCLAWTSERWDDPPAAREVSSVPTVELKKLKAENLRLATTLNALSPRGIHIVVDTAKNRLYLRNGSKVILEAVCSTGNGKVLFDPEKNRKWEFNTPHGEFYIFKKVYRPVWTKPDWAFIEEGEKIPLSSSERIEEEMLGDYAMHIGDGYLIHGTLYTRLLGRNVTHGCVRLGDEDLERVYKAAPVGTPVLIY